MIRKNILSVALVAGVMAIICFACSKGGGSSDPKPDNGFDKAAMLTNYADNLIIPGYTAMQSKVQDLDATLTTFLATPTDANLQLAKAALKNAYLQF